MRSRPMWRAFPSEYLDDALRKTAISEGRSDSNMVCRLVEEALAARRAADLQIVALAGTINSIASTTQ
jgi:hypothetical protein